LRTPIHLECQYIGINFKIRIIRLTGKDGAMGIFEDEEKAMKQEAEDENRRMAALELELRELAQHIRDDLQSYARTNERTDIDLNAQDNHVTVRLRASSDALVINCEGPDAFKVLGLKTGTAPVLDQKTMVREVLNWLQKPLRKGFTERI